MTTDKTTDARTKEEIDREANIEAIREEIAAVFDNLVGIEVADHDRKFANDLGEALVRWLFESEPKTITRKNTEISTLLGSAISVILGLMVNGAQTPFAGLAVANQAVGVCNAYIARKCIGERKTPATELAGLLDDIMKRIESRESEQADDLKISITKVSLAELLGKTDKVEETAEGVAAAMVDPTSTAPAVDGETSEAVPQTPITKTLASAPSETPS